jgi:hypothetical protein
VGVQREGPAATDAVVIKNRLDTVGIDPSSLVFGSEQAYFFRAEDDKAGFRLQVGLPARERPGDLDDGRGAGPIVHCAFCDVVGVDVGGYQYFLLRLGA